MPPFSDKLSRLLVKIPDPGHDADFRVIMSRFFPGKAPFWQEIGQFRAKSFIWLRNRPIWRENRHFGKKPTINSWPVSAWARQTRLGCEAKCLVLKTIYIPRLRDELPYLRGKLPRL